MTPLQQDYANYIIEHELEPYSRVKKILLLLLKSTFLIVLLFRLSHSSNSLIRVFAIPLYKITRIISGVQIPRGTIIGGGLFLPHFGTIVINKKATYGENLFLYHGVTIGAKGAKSNDLGVPFIGDNVKISSGAIVLGSIIVGNNVTIGAGAVVIKDIPDNCAVVGNPARII